MTERELFLSVAWEFLGRPYRFAGDDPLAGFDCSGFVVECLQAVGRFPFPGDASAQGLWERYKAFKGQRPREGDLIFWQNAAGEIVHVEIAVTAQHSIGASGGGREIDTEQEAIDQNAYIKIRPLSGRSRYPLLVVRLFD